MIGKRALQALLERVSVADGSSDSLNVSLYANLNEDWPISEDIARRRVVPDYTGSLDAAAKLVERKLPLAFIQVHLISGGFGLAAAGIKSFKDGTGEKFGDLEVDAEVREAQAATGPLALIAALLRLLIAKEQ